MAAHRVSQPGESPPFRVGQRVRCNARTTTQRGALYHTVELFGRVGTVVAVEGRPAVEGVPGYWAVVVDYDLGQAFGLWTHRAGELVAEEDW
jgi:hypothetical protein